MLDKLEGFSSFLGLSCKGFEKETLDLFCKIENLNRGKFRGSVYISEDGKRFCIESKKLYCEVNYEKRLGWMSEGNYRKGNEMPKS